MKYSQTNTKPSYIPRKLIGGLTQQSAQPEPQNSAGTRRGEVNLGGSSRERVGNHFCRQREDGDWGAGGENTGKAPLPKSSWRESRKLETAAGTELKREKGERRKEKGEDLNSTKTINKGSAESETPQLDIWRCSGGSGRFSGHMGKSGSTSGRTFGRDC